MRLAPYPAETRANGRPLELDLEELNQSDAWALAAEIPLAPHALVLIQLVAWAQVPCGSLPSDETVLRALCRIPAAEWTTMRDVVLRGWWLADDGRMYHDALVERVREMQSRRSKETLRNQVWRARKSSLEKTQRVTNAVSAREATLSGADKTQPASKTPAIQASPVSQAASTGRISGGQVAFAMKRAGLAETNPSSPKLLAMMADGATVPEFVTAAEKAVADGKDFGYALEIVEDQRKKAASLAGPTRTPQMSAIPAGQPIEHPRTIIHLDAPNGH